MTEVTLTLPHILVSGDFWLGYTAGLTFVFLGSFLMNSFQGRL